MDIIDNKDKNIVVDHINHNKADNRRINLRICTRHQNNLNSSNNPRGISKYKGVSLDKKSKIHPWRAYITHNKKFKLIGTFATEKEAALAYNRAIIKYYGEFANPNKIN